MCKHTRGFQILIIHGNKLSPYSSLAYDAMEATKLYPSKEFPATAIQTHSIDQCWIQQTIRDGKAKYSKHGHGTSSDVSKNWDNYWRR